MKTFLNLFEIAKYTITRKGICFLKLKNQHKTFKKMYDFSGILKVSTGILKENEKCRFLRGNVKFI